MVGLPVGRIYQKLKKKNPFENKNVEVRENDLRWCI